jgi:AraC family transcriptional activator of pobA
MANSGLSLQRIDSSLRETVWRIGQAEAPGIVALENGRGRIESADDEPVPIEGPSLLWFRSAGGRRLRAEAGSTGYVGSVGDDLIARVTADYADASVLRPVLERDHDVRDDEALPMLANLSALYDELRVPRTGSSIAVAAQFRILLVALGRLSSSSGGAESGGSNMRFLQQFRELVESNFRVRWPISRYAETIGISTDRLHSLCTRQLAKTPKALIAERVAREAVLGLERSTLSIEQLGYSLGFRDSAHFSHFFKRVMGISPGAFRRLGGSSQQYRASRASFADWP